MANLAIVAEIIGKDLLSPAANAASQSLQGLAGASSAASTLLPGVAIATAGMTAALGSAVKTAADFEKTMSGVKAVMSPQEVQQFGGALEGLALTLGKDTAYSAKEAAAGIEELIKGGLTAQDVLGGAARSTLALAAAGGVSLPDAATIAANALAQFNLKGEDMAHVADLIAGAANASAIGVSDFKFSLAAAGAVASTVGFSFDDLAQGIAVMGKAGIIGSDAGTSLKTMMLNLQPSTKAQNAEFRRLGLFAIDSAAAMQQLTGMMEGNERATAEWGRKLKAGKTDVTDLFDALGSAGVVAEGVTFEQWASQVGLAGNAFFDASGKVKGMADVAEILQTSMEGMTDAQRLASLEILFGSDAIRAGAVLSKAGAEGFNEMADAMGKVTAEAVGAARLDNLNGSLEQLGGSLETVQIEIGQKLLPLFRPLVDGATGVLNAFLNLSDEWKTAVAIGGAVVTGLAVLTTAGLTLLAVLPAITAGFAAVSAIAGVVAAVFTGPVLLAVAAVVAAGALLTAAWVNNWGDIQGKTAAVWGFLQRHVFTPIRDALAHFRMVALPQALLAWESVTAGIQRTWAGLMAFLQPAIAAFGAFWQAHHGTIERVVKAAWDQMTLGIRVAWELLQGIVMAGLALLQGDWQGAWDIMGEHLASAWELIQDTVGRSLALLADAIGATFSAIGTTVHDALAALGTTITTAWNDFTAFIGDRLNDIHTSVTKIWNLIPQDIREDLILIASILKEGFDGQVKNIGEWMTALWATITTTWAGITTSIGAALGEIGTALSTAWGVIQEGVSTAWSAVAESIGGAVGEAGGHVEGFAGNVLAVLAQLAGDVWSVAKSIGGNIIEAIKDGVSSAAEGLGNAAADAVRGALDAAKRAIGVSTPARADGRGAGGPPVIGGDAAASAGAEGSIGWAMNKVGSQSWNWLCQKFVENAYGTGGRYSSAKAAAAALMTNRGGTPPRGSLAFFAPDPSNAGFGHVGIALGGGQFISATANGVKVDSLSDSYWGRLFQGYGLPRFASGVRGFGGGLALVGEQGPEIAYLPPGSNVYSNRESRQMVGGTSYHVTVNVPGLVGDKDDVVRAMYHGLRELERSGLTLGSR